eukprot:251189-Prorocentrum_minimum.AAC.8
MRHQKGLRHLGSLVAPPADTSQERDLRVTKGGLVMGGPHEIVADHFYFTRTGLTGAKRSIAPTQACSNMLLYSPS